MAFFSDHLGVLLVVAVVLVLVATWGGVGRLRKTWRQEPRRRGALAGAVISLLIAGGGLILTGQGLVKLGPGLWRQGRMVGQPAPTLGFTRLVDGGADTLEAQRGKVVLVNFWATWCPPCREEMPDLDRLQQAYAERGLLVLQISDEDDETIRSYLELNPMSTLHGRVDEILWPAPGRPATFVVDRQGVVRRAMLGGRTFEQFEREVKRYL